MGLKEAFKANPAIDNKYIFVFLPQESADIYEQHIKRATDACDLKVDSYLNQTEGNALDAIWERTQRAGTIICDITGFNPNVMYELGVVSTVKDHIVIICEKSDQQKLTLPFNIYNQVVHYYDRDNLDKLSSTLIRVLEKIQRQLSGFTKAWTDDPELKKLMKDVNDARNNGNISLALTLLQVMDQKEPKNWYILNQWGKTYRMSGDLGAAEEKFRQATDHAEFDEQQAEIYIELALLHAKANRKADALGWFERAEKLNKENKELYIAWAEFYEELQDFRNAQSKINHALAEIDSNDKDLNLRWDYYTRKIKEPNFTTRFAEFKRAEERRPSEPVPVREEIEKPDWLIDWDEFQRKYLNKIVKGTINNVNLTGIFVTLTRDISGLIRKDQLPQEYQRRFSIKQPIHVRIVKTFVDRDGRKRAELRLSE